MKTISAFRNFVHYPNSERHLHPDIEFLMYCPLRRLRLTAYVLIPHRALFVGWSFRSWEKPEMPEPSLFGLFVSFDALTLAGMNPRKWKKMERQIWNVFWQELLLHQSRVLLVTRRVGAGGDSLVKWARAVYVFDLVLMTNVS